MGIAERPTVTMNSTARLEAMCGILELSEKLGTVNHSEDGEANDIVNIYIYARGIMVQRV